MAELKKIACGWCDHVTEDAEEAVTHMIVSGHGISPKLKKDLMDSGELANLAEALVQLQKSPDLGEPLTEEDMEELPEEVQQQLRKFEEREGKLRKL